MRIAILTPPTPPADRKGLDLTVAEASEVAAALDRLGHEQFPAIWHDDMKRTEADLRKLEPDLVFNLVDEIRDGKLHSVAALLEKLRLPHTGATAAALEALGDPAGMRGTLTEGGLPVAATAPLDGRTEQVALIETLRGPAPLSVADAELERLGIAAWRIFALTGYASVLFHIESGEKPSIVTVNPNPSLAESAAFCTAAKAAGMSQTDVVAHLIAAAQA